MVGVVGSAEVRSYDGFDDLFREEFSAVVHAAYLITGNRATATEIAQDAFTEAVVRWRKIQNYDRPGAWVRRSAIRKAVKVRQRDERRRRLSIEASKPDVQQFSDDSVGRIGPILAVLSPKQRAMVVLHYIDGLAVHEAADIVGCRPATASVHLHRARERLAKQYGDETNLGKVIIDA